MGVRTNLDISLQVGRNGSLSERLLDESFSSLLDTLDHATIHEATLSAGESNYLVPFGDVQQARLVLVRANGAIRLTPGGGSATSAAAGGAGGSFPTGFVGGELLDLEVDGLSVGVVFEATDQSLAQVIARINCAAVNVPIIDGSGDPVTIAKSALGQVRIESPLTGTSSVVEVLVTTDAAVLIALGLAVQRHEGINASPGQTPVTLTKPASTAGSDAAEGVPVFFFGTLQTTALTVDSLESTNSVRLMVAIVGDIVSS